MTDFTVTRRAITLGDRDETTGWRDVSYVEPENTTEAIIYPKGTISHDFGIGIFAREDAVGITCDPVLVNDLLETENGKTYIVTAVQEHFIGNSFICREAQLKETLQTSPITASATSTYTPSDPRYRTKNYFDYYTIDDGNNFIDPLVTMDDDATLSPFIFMYANQPYSSDLEFYHPSEPIDALAIIHYPQNVKPLMNVTDKRPWAYEETVPIETFTVDKAGITGEKLLWKMTSMIKQTLESYPFGSSTPATDRSLRDIRDETPTTRRVGNSTFYSVKTLLTYRRNTTA